MSKSNIYSHEIVDNELNIKTDDDKMLMSIMEQVEVLTYG